MASPAGASPSASIRSARISRHPDGDERRRPALPQRQELLRAAEVLRRRLPGPAGAGGVAAARRAGQDLLHPDVVPPPGEEVVLVGEPLAAPQPELAEADLAGVAAEACRAGPPQPVLHRVDGEPVQVLVAPPERRLQDLVQAGDGGLGGHQQPPPHHRADPGQHHPQLVHRARHRNATLGHNADCPGISRCPRRFPATSRAAGPAGLRTGVSGRCPPRSLSCPEK